jgi:hypothetical protein
LSVIQYVVKIASLTLRILIGCARACHAVCYGLAAGEAFSPSIIEEVIACAVVAFYGLVGIAVTGDAVWYGLCAGETSDCLPVSYEALIAEYASGASLILASAEGAIGNGLSTGDASVPVMTHEVVLGALSAEIVVGRVEVIHAVGDTAEDRQEEEGKEEESRAVHCYYYWEINI